jgi:hypothetical protein
VTGLSPVLVGGPRTTRLTETTRGPLATVTIGLLGLGVMSAAVMSAGHGLRAPLAQGHAGVLPPALATAPSVFSPPETPTFNAPVAVTNSAGVASAVAAAATDGPIAVPSPSAPVATSPTVPTTPTSPGGTAPPPPSAGPTVQVSAALNAGVTTAAVSVGVGPGSCVGVSVAGSQSCAGPAPAKPGVVVSVVTPLVTVTTPTASPAKTPVLKLGVLPVKAG